MPSDESERRTSRLSDEELEQVVDRYMEELADGKSPDQEAYLRAYPHLADALRGVFKTLHLVEAAGRSLNASKLEAGQRLGEFRIVREIGRGGMGVVYEAVQTSLNRRVALKVLPANVVLSDNAVERFDREAHTAGRLHHTNIVPVYAVGEESGISYYAMQYIRGRSLAYFLKTARQGGLIVDRQHFRRVARWGQQVAEALAYAHEQGVIHRDIKPANILLDVKENVWVFDFGLARTEDSPTITQTGDLVGTAAYMSPEQISDCGPRFDRRTDIYSLGATLYELISLTPAYDAESHAMVLQQIAHRAPKRLRQIVPAAPRDLETIIAKCMHRDSGLRYQTAAEVAEDLRRFLAGEPILAKRDSTWYLVQKTIRRHKLPVAAAVAFVLLIMASAVTLAVMYGQQRHLREQAEQQARMIQDERDRALAAEGKARQRFEQVRELANSIIFDVHDKIADLPGATPARQFVVSKGLEYLSRLAQESTEDPAVLRDLAEGYLRIGDVQGGMMSGAHLGDTPGAMKSYRQALANCQAWAAAQPRNPETRRTLIMCYDRLADALSQTGQTQEALKTYRAALEAAETAAKELPDDLRTRRSVAVAMVKLANVLNTLGQREDALATYEQGLNGLEGLLRAEPSNNRYREDVCVGHFKIGLWLLDAHRTEDALPHIQHSLEMVRALAGAEPNNARYQRLLSVCLDSLGNALQGMDRIDEALVSFREGLEISEKLASADPTNAQGQRDLEVGHNNIGRLEAQAGRHTEALNSHEKALRIAETLAKGDPDNSYLRRDLALCLRATAADLLQTERPADAIAHYERALEISKAMAAADTSNVNAHADIHEAWDGLAGAHRSAATAEDLTSEKKADHLRAAKSAYTEDREVLKALQEAGHLTEEESGRIEELAGEIAECDRLLQELAR
jgi:eukaryotic-like serine/threonine-protein kinase